MIYFIQAGRTGPVKIGRARDPFRRLASMDSGSPVPLRLLALMPGDAAEERGLHARFVQNFFLAVTLFDSWNLCRSNRRKSPIRGTRGLSQTRLVAILLVWSGGHGDDENKEPEMQKTNEQMMVDAVARLWKKAEGLAEAIRGGDASLIREFQEVNEARLALMKKLNLI